MIIQAMQFVIEESAEQMREFCPQGYVVQIRGEFEIKYSGPGNKPSSNEPLDKSSLFYIDGPFGGRVVGIGDWVIKYEDGKYENCTDWVFQRAFKDTEKWH